MFLPMFLNVEGSEKRIPLQKIAVYEPDFTGAIPTLNIMLDVTPPEWIEIRFVSAEELRIVVGNLDALTSTIPISKTRSFKIEGPPEGEEGGSGDTLH